MVVLGEGRRGAGNLVLGFPGDRPDITSPLPPVVAYGVVETTQDSFTITVREFVGNQIDVEIVSSHGQEIPNQFEEKLRWTYSTWKPGVPLPSTGQKMREVRISEKLELGIAPLEKRIILHDGSSGMNHLIPITNFYNELMMHKSVRDPKVALNSNLLFQNLRTLSDEDLRKAFISYNKLKPRVSITEPAPAPKPSGFTGFVKTLFGKHKP